MQHVTKFAKIQFKTHTSHIGRTDDDQLVVFKHNRDYCDIDVFPDNDLAADYISSPLPDLHYFARQTED